jgi:hypothetical protein
MGSTDEATEGAPAGGPARGGRAHRWGTLTGIAAVIALLVVAVVGQLTKPDQPRPPDPTTSVVAAQSTPSPSPDAEPPTDAAARQSAEQFMRDLSQRAYEHAWSELCGSGQEEFPNGAALRKALGLENRSVAGYTITGVRPATFNGDARKVVAVQVTYAPEGTGSLNLSVTQEHGQPALCGF